MSTSHVTAIIVGFIIGTIVWKRKEITPFIRKVTNKISGRL